MALIKRIGFTLFDRWGKNLGRVAYTEAEHTEALDGTDELSITCERELSKGQRLVWVDRQGIAHEHMVDEVSQVHEDGGRTYCKAVCVNSVAELWDDYIEDKRPSGSVDTALSSILAGTRWKVGRCDFPGTASHTFYHVSVREGLTDLISVWGGELETTVDTDGSGITARHIGVRSARGDQKSPKRFTWTKDIVDIKRTVGSVNPKTRVYGYGKGVETDTGGYGRRLTFGDINDGRDYVEDAEATKVWGHPDGNGGILPAVDTFIDEECEDAAQLLQETRDYLEKVKEPTVSYEANVIDLFAYGRSWEGVGLGDLVAIVDKEFAESGLRLKGRVSQIKRDLVTGETTVTFGTLVNALTDMWQNVSMALKGASSTRATLDAVSSPSVGWLTLLQSALNKQFNAVGTYKVESFELGQIFSNVALNPETGTPIKSTASMWAVNINGMGIRLASSLTSRGEWDWTTFITGASVNADCINAGTMTADRVRAGILTDEKGKNYWDLNNGELSIGSGAKLGGKSIATTDAAISSVAVEYASGKSNLAAPDDGWSPTAPPWSSGAYVWQRTCTTMQDGSKTCSAPTCVSGRDGKGISSIREQFYLSTSSFSLTGGSWSNTQQNYEKGCYYWTRSVVNWADESTTFTDPVLAIGVNTAIVKAQEASDSVKQIDLTLTPEGVFNILTNGGQEQGIYRKDDKVYINGEYISAGTFSVRNEKGEVVATLSAGNGSGLQVKNPFTGTMQDLAWSAFIPIYSFNFSTGKDGNNCTWNVVLGDSKQTTSYTAELNAVPIGGTPIPSGWNRSYKIEIYGYAYDYNYMYQVDGISLYTSFRYVITYEYTDVQGVAQKDSISTDVISSRQTGDRLLGSVVLFVPSSISAITITQVHIFGYTQNPSVSNRKFTASGGMSAPTLVVSPF